MVSVLCVFLIANLSIVQGDLWRARGLNREALPELRHQRVGILFEGITV
jgi:LuxR family maltose regulon positive regulatory protein